MDELSDWHTDATLAVVAHSLLGSMTVVVGALKTIQRLWDDLDGDDRDQLVAAAVARSIQVAGVLGDLARGTPLADLDLLGDGDLASRRRRPT